ncbi:MAG: hypothetical protein K6356_03375 [Chloroflexus sp.]
MDTISWPADDRLCDLLRRYYQGEAGLWPEILRCIERELQVRQLPPAPRHARFRRTGNGYIVEISPA